MKLWTAGPVEMWITAATPVLPGPGASLPILEDPGLSADLTLSNQRPD
jgi:hypothetical protein